MQFFMQYMSNLLIRARQTAEREEGQGTVEYVLVLGLLSIVFVGLAVSGLVTPVTDAIGNIAADLNSVV